MAPGHCATTTCDHKAYRYLADARSLMMQASIRNCSAGLTFSRFAFADLKPYKSDDATAPSMDSLWNGTARFQPTTSFP